jgi:hypothetical protein
MIFYINIFEKKIVEKIGIFTQNKAKLCKTFDRNIGFWEKRHFSA